MSRASLSLIIPFRDDDGSRTAVKEWIVARWTHFLPDAEIIVQGDDGGTPFSKTLAVNRAFEVPLEAYGFRWLRVVRPDDRRLV